MAARVLVIDIDQEALIPLVQTLEDEGFDTTTTWNVREARQLFHGSYFDFLVVADHPPELDAVAILREAHRQGCCGASVVLTATPGSNIAQFASIGAIAVLPNQDYQSVLGAVKRHLQVQDFLHKAAPLVATKSA